MENSKKPFSNLHIWEHTTYGLYYVDSADQTILLKTVDEGVNVDIVTNQAKKIQAGYLNGNDLWLVLCDNPDNEFTVLQIELDNNDNILLDINSSGQDAGTVYAWSIFKTFAGAIRALATCDESATGKIQVWDVDQSPMTTHKESNQTTPTLVSPIFYDGTGSNYIFQLDLGNDIYMYSYNTILGFLHYTPGGKELSNYSIPTNISQRCMYLNDLTSSLPYMILTKDSDGKEYLTTFDINTATWTPGIEFNYAFQEYDNVSGTIPNEYPLAYSVSGADGAWLVNTGLGLKVQISAFNWTDTLVAQSNTYAVDDSGNLYKYTNQLKNIFEGFIYHFRNYFPYLEMKFNSDNITIVTQMLIQIIGPYTADGSTTANQIVFEGIAKKPTKGRIQFVLIENLGFEMEYISPRGNKSGRTDEIIVDINNDGAPDGPTYINDGTLANGGAMGLLDLSGAKLYRTVLNDFAEHDTFLWALRPQGALDYNAGGIDSGAGIRFDGAGNLDVILQIQAWTVAKLNQIIVNGALNIVTGEPYTGNCNIICNIIKKSNSLSYLN